VDQRLREIFDEQLQIVIDQAPPQVKAILDEVPVVVDDQPTPKQLAKLGLGHNAVLCGLYTGIPLTKRSVMYSGVLSDSVALFRDGIVHTTIATHGFLSEDKLRDQIRITLWHELGHHVGLDEDDLDELGYG
jgi:predicted Zn-dependent protease with MMP-like domain